MKFYEIKNRILRLDLIRDANLHENEICICYSCGDVRTDRIIFKSDKEATEAFRELCNKLYRL